MFYACCIITIWKVVQAVVKATSQSNGESRFLTTPINPKPQRISMKLRTYNYIRGITIHAKLGGTATTCKGKHVIYHVSDS